MEFQSKYRIGVPEFLIIIQILFHKLGTDTEVV